MLSFYKHKIYFTFEMNEVDTFYATSLPYCSKSAISDLFPNVELFEKFTRDELENSDVKCILLSPEEFRGFIDSWVEHSLTNKLYNWDSSSFFAEYVKTLKQIATIDGDFQFDGRWEGDEGLFTLEKIDEINNIDISSITESPIEITYNCEPELSLKVEDALYAFKNNGSSLYTNEINELIQYNIRKIGLTKSLYSNFAGKNFFQPNLTLNDSISLETIDYSNPNCIFYFYYYSFLPGIKSNIIHLKKVLEAMAK